MAINTVNTQLLQEISVDNQLYRFVYQDKLGTQRIGVNRKIDPRESWWGGLYDDEVQLLLQNDINGVVAQFSANFPRWKTNLNEARQAVLIGLAFVTDIWAFKEAFKLAIQGHFEQSAAAIVNGPWANINPDRVLRLSVQMETGEWQPILGNTLP